MLTRDGKDVDITYLESSKVLISCNVSTKRFRFLVTKGLNADFKLTRDGKNIDIS